MVVTTSSRGDRVVLHNLREIPQILDRHRQDGRLATRRQVKEWVRSQIAK
ncbi:hypothetical protein JJD41_19360 [Oxynema sp. CENA135]|nr:hypothetical protein [Oxynema sp. CENA135]MBK4732011.1 hypothetical protein [Oxynema sp. CENA135]